MCVCCGCTASQARKPKTRWTKTTKIEVSFWTDTLKISFEYETIISHFFKLRTIGFTYFFLDTRKKVFYLFKQLFPLTNARGNHLYRIKNEIKHFQLVTTRYFILPKEIQVGFSTWKRFINGLVFEICSNRTKKDI